MRTLIFNKNGLNKVKAHGKEFKASDFEGSVKSCHPGEWCIFKGDSDYLGFINPLIEDQYTCAYLISTSKGDNNPLNVIKMRIEKAFNNRFRFESYKDGSRLFYGMSDGLPGLIIDTFLNANVIQINTSGIDTFREEIRLIVNELTKKESYFLDNLQYRAKEFLPIHNKEVIPDISIIENGLKYSLRSEVLQKVGFYYDHRENRNALSHLMKRLTFKFNMGVDLFSYIGAWGTVALSAGCQRMDYVDQGDFQIEISKSLQNNGLNERGEFHRKDVFKFLDEKITENKKYDLVLSDPPAFAKSMSQKKQALDGYSKLHRKVFKIASEGALCAFSSCTHYVSHDEFLKNIQEAAFKENKKIQLLFTGIQGWDHPVSSLTDRSNYIKSYFYFVESL